MDSKLNLNLSDFFKVPSVLILVLLIYTSIMTSCSGSGNISGASGNQVLAPVIIKTPTITSPLQNPYTDRNSTVVVTGQCMSGYEVKLTNYIGIMLAHQECENYVFSFTLTQLNDAVNTYFIQQIDPNNGEESTPVTFIWIKKSSISKPAVTLPAVNPYESADLELQLEGTCESGSQITLSVGATGTTTCVDSHFSMKIPKSVDGTFAITVTQSDSAGNTNSSTFTWIKKLLSSSPASPTLTVGTVQVFSFKGGSGIYSATLVSSPSGGNYVAQTKTYTAGTTANVVDVLRISDSAGATFDMSIYVVAGDPDHFNYGSPSSGDLQTVKIGQLADESLNAIIVDRYDNAIPNYPVKASISKGDGKLDSSVIQVSDNLGRIAYQYKAGYHDLQNTVQIRPVTGDLPDLALTGRSKINFSLTSQFLNTGVFGQAFFAGQAPTVTKVIDLDADSKKDVIVLNTSDPSIGIFLGLGNGLLKNQFKINSICASPNDLVIADFNLDTKPDIAISCGNSVTTALQIFLGIGDGTFATKVSLVLDASELIPNALIAVDINSDGKLDLISTNAGSASVSVRLGIGDGTFLSVQSVSLPVGASPSGVTMADINKDGKKDLVVLNSALNSMSFLVAQNVTSTSVVFDNSSVASTGNGPLSIVSADFNEDSFVDLAVLNSGDGEIAILINDQSGIFNQVSTLTTGVGPNALVLAKLNSDIHEDLVVPNTSDGTLSAFYGRGTGLFDAIPVFSGSLNPKSVAVDLMNQDTIPDLVIAGESISERYVEVLSGQIDPAALPGDINLYYGNYLKTGLTPTDAVFTDFNSDSKVDIAVLESGSKTISLYYGNGEGLFSPSNIVLNTNDTSTGLLTLDSRGNGRKDLVAINNTKSSIRIFLAQANGTFAAPVDITVGSSPISGLVYDLNHDNRPDLLVLNTNSNSVSVLLGVGDGTYLTKADYVTAGNPSSMVLSDVNSDGEPDLLVSNKSSNSFSVLISNGNGSFQNHIDYTVGGAPNSIVGIDVNNDLIVDAVNLNSSEGSMTVNIGNGDGSFRLANYYSAGNTVDTLNYGDFNGDGRPDFVINNGVSGLFTILNGSSNGSYNSIIEHPTDYTTGAVKSFDINNDSAIDLFIFDQTKNQVQIRMGH